MISVIILTATGLSLALAIGLVVHFFGVKPDPKLEAISPLMPGANCGGCSFAGCNAYAAAMAAGQAKPGLCPSMNNETLDKISEILGVQAEKVIPPMAIVLCSGDHDHAIDCAGYNGVTDCTSANTVAGGGKACAFGCLGMGTCSRICPWGAIEMVNGIAKVHWELCVGCGKCVAACPRHLIKLVPRTAEVHVFCSSPEPFKVKKEACSVACIGCRKCGRATQPDQMTFNGSLAAVNYENVPASSVCEVCPTKCLRTTDAPIPPQPSKPAPIQAETTK